MENKLLSLLKILDKEKEILFKDLQSNLKQFLFDSIYINHPKQLFLYLNSELTNFLLFLKTKDIEIPCSYGKFAISKGLDENVMLLFFDIVQNFMLSYIDLDRDIIKIVTKLANEYIRHYLAALRAERNLKKDLEQEQLYKTVNSIIETQQQKILQLHKKKIKVAQDEAEKRKQFSVNLAHDTMSPLMQVLLHIKNYMETRNEEDLFSLQSNIHKLIEMMGSFFDYEQIQRGKMIYTHKDYFNLSGYLECKINLSINLFKNKNVKIYTDIENDIFIQINKHALDRIINNIFDNAVKYNIENGTIKVILKKNKDKNVLFIIKDTGIGMSKERLNNLFLPYYENTSKIGTGYGLSIIKEILDEINSTIHIESTENAGTTVTITFVEADIKNAENITTNSNSPIFLFHNPGVKIKDRPYNKLKQSVLIVEDDPESLSLLYDKISEEYNVFYSDSGKKALELFSDSLIPLPEIIISDIMMKDIDGHEFHNIIRSHETFKHIPVIFITAKRDEADKIKSYQQGILDYIQKPFLIDELLFKIKALLNTINFKNQQSYLVMMRKNRDQVMRDPANDNFICWYLTCEKYEFKRREREVARYCLDGFLVKEIAERLSISHHTVNTHLRTIYSKCKINNRSELNTLFTFYEKELKKVLNTDYKNEKAIEEALQKDWKLNTYILI